MKVLLKWIIIICLIPIVLLLLVSILLYIPPIQNFAVKKAAEYASEASQMQIGIKKVRLSFPLDLTVQGVEVITSPGDTLLTLDRFTISINPAPLLKKEISVTGVGLEGAKVNTGSFIEGIEVKGMIGALKARADRIDLTNEQAFLNSAKLSDATLTVIMADTTEKADTASVPVNWKIDLGKVALENVLFALQMPLDSIWLSSMITDAELTDGSVDLGTSTYQVGKFTIHKSALNYDTNSGAPLQGLDASHIRLDNINLQLDSIYNRGLEAKAVIREFSMDERSGLSVTSLTGSLVSDSTWLRVPGLSLRTPNSEANLQVSLPWTALDSVPVDVLSAVFDAKIGKKDILIAAGNQSAFIEKNYPDRPLTLDAEVEGNLARLDIRRLKGTLPGALRMDIFGVMKSLNDSLKTSGDFNLSVEAGNLNFVLGMLPAVMRESYKIPYGMKLTGKAAFKGNDYQAAMLLREGNGTVSLTGRYNMKLESYKADLKVDSLEPNHFMPKDSIFWVTADVQAEGQGTDVFRARTWSTITGKISEFKYGSREVSDIKLSASLKEHAFKAAVNSAYPMAVMDLTLDGTLTKEQVKAMFIADVQKFDLQGLQMADMPLTTSFQIFSEAESNLKNDHTVDVTLGNWDMCVNEKSFKPKTLTLHLRADDDTTRVSFHAGDFGILLTGNANAQVMVDKLLKVSDKAIEQLERDTTINFPELKPLLPEMHLQVNASTDNPIYNYLQQTRVFFDSLSVEGFTSPEEGIKLNASLLSLISDTTKIDTIHFSVWQDTAGLKFTGDVKKKRFRLQDPFTIALKGELQSAFVEMEGTYLNGKGETGVYLGARVSKVHGGLKLHLFPEDVTLAFLPFKLNKENYFIFRSMKDLEADIKLTGQRYASLSLYSERDTGALQSLHLEISQISLDTISKGMPGFPSMKGNLNGSVRYEPLEKTFIVAAEANVDNMYYQGGRIGGLLLSAVYLPLDNNDHQFDVHLYRDEAEISSLFAVYKTGKPDKVEGNISINHLPLEMLSPLVPDGMVKMNGALVGDMAISGTSETPLVNGYMRLDTAKLYVVPAGSTLSFDTSSIRVKDNLITFNKYKINSKGNNSFIIDGKIDAKNTSRITADLKMSANNMLLLDAKRTNESLVYGKLLVDFNSTLKGPLSGLTMRGGFSILGSTNLTYVMKDSPLTVQDRLSGLVTFTYFEDTIPRSTARFRPGEMPAAVDGMDILLNIHVDPVVRFNVDLSADQSSRVELNGGGDLAFQYNRQGDMTLTGRYTLSGGEVKYAFPVIGTKDLVIKDGSYVDWSGDPMDPMLNLTATERVRTSVTPTGQNPRIVNFDAGISIKQRLANLSLQFTLDAPEDMTIQDELKAKGEEERNKLAIAMLVTGMYIAEGYGGGSGGLDMNSALNSFLQSEINSIAGSVLKGVDVSFGMDSYDAGAGGAGTRTDYSFRFSKRFYNDRINIIIGGRISTGATAGENQSFIDDASIEYRLDEGGTRYVKLFHNKNYESLLEGEITETGAGIVFRRKMKNLTELFIFRKKKPAPVNEEEEKDE